MSTSEHPQEWADRVLQDPPDEQWILRQKGYVPAVEREAESRLSIGNGLLGVRGSLETPTLASRPRTLVAGLFDAVQGASGGPFLAPAPDWLRLGIIVNGSELGLDGEQPHHVRALDMSAGVLRTEWSHRLPSGEPVRVSALRLASLADRSTALQVVRMTSPERSQLTLEAMLVPTTLTLTLEEIEGNVSYWKTMESRRGLIIAMNAQLFLNNVALAPDADGNRLSRRWTWESAPDERAVFVRNATFVKYGRREERMYSKDTVTRAARRSHEEIYDQHLAAWSGRLQASDARIVGDADDQRALRFAVYHLISAANPEDESTSIGARGLTGDAYGGHVFWDTEIFLLPFYTFTWPEAARALLMYRYHTLPAAKAKASRLGYTGALYAWESADTGDEATPESAQLPDGKIVPILSGLIEHHISADIAFAVWQYWQATGDESFLRDAGAEILLETARFWSSRASREADGRCHIRGVIGPDEYHEEVDDNAYTNLMAQWNLETGLAVADLLRRRWRDRWTELMISLGLTEHDLLLWEETARDMYNGFDSSTDLFEQFKGYFGLEPIDLAAYEPRGAAMDVLLGRQRTRQSQVIKQADVVMLMAMLWPRFTARQHEANFRYYESRCGHGSSLSPGVHALVAARIGDQALADKYFRETASIDLADATGNVSGGVHMAALGSLWQATIFGFAGMSLSAEGLSFEPHMPERWSVLSFAVRYGGCTIRIDIARAPSTLRARVEDGTGPVAVDVNGVVHSLNPGESHTWDVPSLRLRNEAAR